MAEIKSTLDIIMERAKNLTVTEEEKAAFKRRSMEEKVKGLFQKALSGSINLERLSAEVAGMDEASREAAMGVFLQKCLDAVDPEDDNQPVLAIMEQILKVDTTPLRAILEGFRENLEKGKMHFSDKIKRALKEAGISGSAVVPNIPAAPEWQRSVKELKEKFLADIDSVRDRLTKK